MQFIYLFYLHRSYIFYRTTSYRNRVQTLQQKQIKMNKDSESSFAKEKMAKQTLD